MEVTCAGVLDKQFCLSKLILVIQPAILYYFKVFSVNTSGSCFINTKGERGNEQGYVKEFMENAIEAKHISA